MAQVGDVMRKQLDRKAGRVAAVACRAYGIVEIFDARAEILRARHKMVGGLNGADFAINPREDGNNGLFF